tara:strand:+ start:159 stop:902 length:744 start_codon:yes stop_codon:yes gene_type:complete
MTKGIVLSLYDFTGEALKPWAEAGYTCHAFDIQHSLIAPEVQAFDGGGSITYNFADLHDDNWLNSIRDVFGDKPVVFGMAFPVCTDMAVSGAAHFKRKAEANPFFQADAVGHVTAVARMFNGMAMPYFIENPVSVLATKWRKPDYRFHPFQYGGYIPWDQAKHPRWPEYIAAKDAYKKNTCLWTGGGFVMPYKISVDPEAYHGNGYSTSMMKLGGKSQRTKDIRSATPRGFAIAVYEANKTMEKTNA